MNERKTRILEAIINDYIATAEPIGSRTIAKKFDLGVSSATIRNEMSDLEEMGFIVQPHSSAGRVPSDKGYRYYVDSLMTQKELSGEQIEYLRGIVAGNLDKIDYLMKETAKAIAFLTNYTTIVSEPTVARTKIRHFQFVPVGADSLLLVAVTEAELIKQCVLHPSVMPPSDMLPTLSAVISNEISGISAAEIPTKAPEKLADELKGYAALYRETIEALRQLIADEENIAVYTSGVKNLLTFPEFSDLDKARALFSALDERQTLISLIATDGQSRVSGGSEAVQIVIGEENTLANIKDCSVIRANYTLGRKTYGNIGIIGPTRMDYPMVVSVLKGIIGNINRLIGGGFDRSD